MKGQVAAIAAVLAVSVMLLVMMRGLVVTLTETRDAYYERYRLAEVFAPVARAPERLVDRLAAIPGVASAQGRVTGRALIDVAGMALPVQAQAVSLPGAGEAALNDIFLTDGRRPAPERAEEILLLESFAEAHGLRPGDSIEATMNGRRHAFRITGLALAPEFIYTTAPGEMVPDAARFGVIWMGRDALAAAYDMRGAFNEALMTLTRDARPEAVLAAADRLLAPWGGRGAYARDDLPSDIFVSEEIDGLRAVSVAVPPIFLAVVAFLTYIVIGRMVQSEREEIGLLKAFGYTGREVAGHYLKFVLVIGALGAALGCVLGIIAGRWTVDIYQQFYKFPFLVFRLDYAAFAIAVIFALLAAATGALFVLRKVFALAPAEAMRPPAPPDYSRASRIGGRAARLLDQPTRMVIRRVTRQPWRMAGAAVGIACGFALSAAMLTVMAGFVRTVDMTFDLTDRSDVSVTFTHAVGARTLHEIARLPGVQRVEGVRHVPVIFRAGRKTHQGALTALPRNPALFRALDARTAPLALPQDGVLLSRTLASILDLSAGDTLTVEVREGAQPVLRLPVAGVAETLLGAPAYMELAALNRALGEPGRVSGAHLMVDEAQAEALFADLESRPAVAGIGRKQAARDSLVEMMNQGVGMQRFVMGGIAFVIAFGIVYNAARIAFAERARDLASLRVLGFTTGEAGFVLLGELAVVTLAAIPLGALMAWYLAHAIAAGFASEIYQIPVVFDPASFGIAALVILGAALFSGWLVRRDLARADLVAALKTRD
ncbi:ABC transporter permease [Rhodosalinus halophilus]|uniref:ABC transporter permease n=2 Tax=Rhodosalinus halophilus TaxID=2259333 RepID=A0A365U5Y9_9RHOB|nr:ABC transporter permease [Rhodosalinus halophilus]